MTTHNNIYKTDTAAEKRAAKTLIENMTPQHLERVASLRRSKGACRTFRELSETVLQLDDTLLADIIAVEQRRIYGYADRDYRG